jgi:hypothetical protein
MIQAVMVISTQAKPRLLKFYNFQVPSLSSLQSNPTPLSFFTSRQVLGQFPHRDQALLHSWILSCSTDYVGEGNLSLP